MKSANLVTKSNYGLLSVAMVAMALGLSACGGGGSGGGTYYSGGGGGYDPYYNAWYDVYGSYCGTGIPLPGCNYFSDGLKIIDSEDPAFGSSYFLSFNTWVYTDVYGNPNQFYTGWGWVSPTSGILYDDFGNAINAQEEQGRDSMTKKAVAQADISHKAGAAFAEKWGLEEQAGVDLANDLRNWAEWSKTRKRDNAALDEFTKEFTNLDTKSINTMVDAYVKGDQAPIQGGLEIVAQRRRISNPDTVAAIIKDWYKEYIPNN